MPAASWLMERSITPTPPGTWLAAPSAWPTAVTARNPVVGIAAGRKARNANPANNQSTADTAMVTTSNFKGGRYGILAPRQPVTDSPTSTPHETSNNTPTARPIATDNHGSSGGAPTNRIPARNAWPSQPAINR